jgi:O-antigen/teichoic acid export membrane protein
MRVSHRRIAGNTASLVSGRAIGMLLSAASSVLVTRYLGAAQYGEFAALYAYLALFGWLASSGLEGTLPREIARTRARAPEALAAAATISSATAAVALAVALACAPVLGYGQVPLLTLGLAGADILGLASFRLAGAVYQAELRQWVSTLAGIVRQLLWLAFLGVLALSGATLTSLVAARLFCSIVEVAILLHGVRTLLPRRLKQGLPEVKRLFVSSLPVSINALAVAVYHRADQVMLHGMAQSAAVGRYAISASLVELMNVVPVAVMSSLFPVMVQTAHEPGSLERYVRDASRYLLVIAFGACVVFSIAAADILRLLYGESFADGSIVLAVLVWSEVAVFFGVIMTNAVLALGAQRVLPLATGTGAVINLALNAVAIPRFGGVGAAAAAVLSYSIAGIFMYFVFPATRLLAWRAFSSAWPALPAALLSVALAKWLTFGLIASLVFAVALYAGLLVLTGTLRRSDLQLLRTVSGAFGRQRDVEGVKNA